MLSSFLKSSTLLNAFRAVSLSRRIRFPFALTTLEIALSRCSDVNATPFTQLLSSWAPRSMLSTSHHPLYSPITFQSISRLSCQVLCHYRATHTHTHTRIYIHRHQLSPTDRHADTHTNTHTPRISLMSLVRLQNALKLGIDARVVGSHPASCIGNVCVLVS